MSDILELLKWWICGFTEGLFKELHDTSSKAFKAPFLQFLRFQTVGDRDRSFKIFQSQSRMRSTSCCSSPWDAQGDLRPMCSFKGVDQGVVTSAHHDFWEDHRNWMNDYLVGGWPTPLKNVKVSWDDDIPNIWKVIKFMFQTTNQLWWLSRNITIYYLRCHQTWLEDPRTKFGWRFSVALALNLQTKWGNFQPRLMTPEGISWSQNRGSKVQHVWGITRNQMMENNDTQLDDFLGRAK